MRQQIPLLARLERASREAAGYRWYALAMTTFCQAAAVSLTSTIGPLAPLLQADFQVSRAEIGLALTSIYLSSSVVALVGGWAADRAGERSVLVVSGLVAALAGVALSLVESFLAFLVVCFVLGLGNGIQNPAGSAAIMRWFPPRVRGLAMGIRQTGVPVGGFLAAIIWPAVAVAHGWRAAYVLAGLATLIGAALIVVAYYDPPRPVGASRGTPGGFRGLLGDARIWWLGVIFNAQIVAQFSASTYLVLFLHEAHDVSVVTASALLAVVNVAAVAARIGWGVLSDRQFRGRRRPVVVRILWLTLCGMLCAAFMPTGVPPWVMAGLAALIGLSAFAWTGVLGTLIIETAGRQSAATAIALVTAIGGPGSLLGPPLFGLLVDRTGSYRVAWLAVALVVSLGLVAIRRVHERHTDALQPEG